MEFDAVPPLDYKIFYDLLFHVQLYVMYEYACAHRLSGSSTNIN